MPQLRLSGKPLIYAITLSSASCYLLFGYDQGVLGGLVADSSFLDAMGNPSSSYLGAIVALYNVGCLAGCMVSAYWGNVAGRKRSIIWGCVVMVIGAVIQASAYGAGQMIAGRLISGLGNGVNTSTIPIYVSETAKSNRRGRFVAIQLSIVILGTVVAYWLDYGMIVNYTGSIVWRFPVAFQIVFALITIATMPFLPDTPRWLYGAGKKEEAIDVYMRLLSCTDRDDPEVRLFEGEMEEAISIEAETVAFDWKNIFYDRTDLKNYRRLVLCWMIQMMQQFTGINVIAFYVTIVLNVYIGMSPATSSLVAGCIQIVFWLGTFPPMYLIDRFGRRPILIGGSIGLTTCIVIFTAGIAVNSPASSKLALAALFCYEVSFGMSWLSLPWLIAPEITPLHLRHVGSAIGPFSEWLWTFVIVLITPYAIENAGWKFYLLFCVMNALCLPFVYFFIPETNGKTLEEIDYLFASPEVQEQLKARFEHAVEAKGRHASNDPEKGADARIEQVV